MPFGWSLPFTGRSMSSLNMPTVDGLPPTRRLTCRLCGCPHRRVPLARGQRAACVRCGTMLEKRGRFGPHAPPAFALTGLLLALPAATLPFITVSKIGHLQVNLLYSGAAALWESGMRILSTWVFLCGILAPLLLFILLALLIAGTPDRDRRVHSRLLRAAHALEHWAMPEVHVLAVLVALIKLGALVDVSIGPGFWCYTAMAIVLALAWRSFEFEATDPAAAARIPHSA